MTTVEKKYPIVDLEAQNPVRLTLEERYRTLHTVYKYQYFAIFKQIGQRWGWDVANDIADEMAAEAIPVVARGYQRKFGLKGTGARLVAEVLTAEFQAEGGDVELREGTEDTADYHVQCAFGDALQSGKFAEVHITDGLCTRGCWKWTQAVADTVKPGLQVDRLTWMGDGAPSCHFTIQPKGGPEAQSTQ